MTASTPRRTIARLALGAAALAAGALAASAALADPSLVTRTVPWTGGDRLAVAVDGHVRYVQGAQAKVQITAPRDVADHIVVDEHGVIRSDDWGIRGWWRAPWRSDIQIVVTAPRIDQASVSGSARLDLGRLQQDELDVGVSGSGMVTASGPIRTLGVHISGSGGARLDGLSTTDMRASLSGSGWIEAAGAAKTLTLSLSGSGRASLGRLNVQDATASLSGSGSAELAPRAQAEIGASGSGAVRLLTRPAQLRVHRSGSGRVIEADWPH